MSAARVTHGQLAAGPAAATIAFVLGSDVDSAGATVWDVLSATSAVCPALVAGDRHVVGNPTPPGGIDLRLVGIVLEHNGEVVATAAGAADQGHPAAAVADLARRLATAGDPLRAGEIVATAPLAAVAEVRAGDVLVASVGRLGSVEAPVTLVRRPAP